MCLLLTYYFNLKTHQTNYTCLHFRGRFGSVCIATDKVTHRDFAAKFIKVKPSQREELKNEISVMNELHHPKLLMLWDAFETPRQMVLIMEQ